MFSTATRSRGTTYAQERRVTLGRPGPHSVTATVRGSGKLRYACAIDWQHADRGQLGFECTCPAFMSIGPCKHLWATVVAVDAQGLGELVGGRLQLEALDLHDEDYDDLDDDDFTVDDGRRSERVAQRAPGPGPRAGPRPGLPSGRPQEPGWLRTLAPIAAADPALSAPSGRRVQHWFVLNLQQSERKDAFVVEFYRGAAEGGPAHTLRPVRLSEHSLEELDPAERALLELLLHRPASDGMEDFRYRRGWEQFSYALINGELCDVLMPRLARTGRLITRADGRTVPDLTRTLRMEEQPLRLHLHMMERASSWLLTATLVQEQVPGAPEEERAWPLTDADLVLSTGHLLKGDVLYRVAMQPGAQQWLDVLRKQSVVEIPHRDRGALLEFFANYSGEVPLHLPATLRLIESVGAPQPCLLLRTLDSYDGRHVDAQLTFAYGERRVQDAERPAAWIDEAARTITRRDFAGERRLRDELTQYGATFVRNPQTPPGQPSMEARVPLAGLMVILGELAARQWRVELQNKRVAFATSSEWHVKSGVDWFELQGGLQFAGASAGLPELLKALRRGESFVALTDGSTGIIPEAWRARLDTMARLGSIDGTGVRFKVAQALLLDALLAERADERLAMHTDAAYRRRLNELRDGEKATAVEPPASFRGELRPYQREGLGWFQFLQRLRVGGCLADDMGLGKTVQVLALLDARRQEPRALPSIVVVPKSLVFNWQHEAARFTPQLRVLAYVGAGRHALTNQLRRTDVVLTTYATLLRDISHMKDVRFDYAILDEAQSIKNESSQSAKACRLLTAQHRLAMSGTPIENHLGELWSLFEFLNPGLLGTVATFRTLTDMDSAEDLAALQRALRPFILRRTKAQVLTDLPAKSEQTLLCELSTKERRNYDQLLNHYRSTLLSTVRTSGIKKVQIHVLEALLRLRQAALHPGLLSDEARHDGSAKFALLMEQLEDVLPQGHKALIFSQFTGLLALLRARLDARGWNYAYLDGKTRDREAVVRGFQETPEQQLFLISLRAGGQGLNLTAADYVFILDPWWNPAVEAQAIDRAHRIGQERKVFAYRLIAADTIEQKIVELQSKKRELAEAIITAENAAPSALTAEDLELLLS